MGGWGGGCPEAASDLALAHVSLANYCWRFAQKSSNWILIDLHFLQHWYIYSNVSLATREAHIFITRSHSGERIHLCLNYGTILFQLGTTRPHTSHAYDSAPFMNSFDMKR